MPTELIFRDDADVRQSTGGAQRVDGELGAPGRPLASSRTGGAGSRPVPVSRMDGPRD
jgi:hypothetical protein